MAAAVAAVVVVWLGAEHHVVRGIFGGAILQWRRVCAHAERRGSGAFWEFVERPAHADFFHGDLGAGDCLRIGAGRVTMDRMVTLRLLWR